MTTPEEDERLFRLILEAVRQIQGFDGRNYKPNYLKRRVAIRMRATGAADYENYLRILRNDPKEIPFLVDRLTVHVTEFFRDSEVYTAVERSALPPLEQRFGGKPWNVLSAGCSTGEEAFSIAIMLQEWRETHAAADFVVDAFDIDPDSIGTAERGSYPASSIAKVPSERMKRWFLSAGRRVEVAPEIRRKVRFQVRDLTAPWDVETPHYHLVFCRNLLIYFNVGQHQSMFERFARALHPGGVLVLGRTEALLGRARGHFLCTDVRNRIYRRLDG
jgi:chemotaxis methyl-accepting protein methylase